MLFAGVTWSACYPAIERAATTTIRMPLTKEAAMTQPSSAVRWPGEVGNAGILGSSPTEWRFKSPLAHHVLAGRRGRAKLGRARRPRVSRDTAHCPDCARRGRPRGEPGAGSPRRAWRGIPEIDSIAWGLDPSGRTIGWIVDRSLVLPGRGSEADRPAPSEFRFDVTPATYAQSDAGSAASDR